jgi:2-polyprenyl-3-methyl-5-hydroxy-6-metoxy-1,4-benzoquinol methylase
VVQVICAASTLVKVLFSWNATELVGAIVTGIDLSPKMIEVSKANSANLEIDYHEDSVTTLQTIPDSSVDFIISNYVIQVAFPAFPSDIAGYSGL